MKNFNIWDKVYYLDYWEIIKWTIKKRNLEDETYLISYYEINQEFVEFIDDNKIFKTKKEASKELSDDMPFTIFFVSVFIWSIWIFLFYIFIFNLY